MTSLSAKRANLDGTGTLGVTRGGDVAIGTSVLGAVGMNVLVRLTLVATVMTIITQPIT